MWEEICLIWFLSKIWIFIGVENDRNKLIESFWNSEDVGGYDKNECRSYKSRMVMDIGKWNVIRVYGIVDWGLSNVLKVLIKFCLFEFSVIVCLWRLECIYFLRWC